MSGAVIAAVPQPRSRLGFLAGYTLAQVSAWLAFMPLLGILLPLKVSALAPDHRVAVLGLVSGLAATVAVLANPIAGLLSDRTRSRFGRRRPWLVAGVIATAASYAPIALASNIPTLVAGVCLFQLCFNSLYAALQALVPDRVPESQRGAISGLVGLGSPLGGLIGAQVVGNLVQGEHARFAVLATLVLAGILPWSLSLREPRLAPPARRGWLGTLKSFWLDPRQHPDFAAAWIGRLLVMLGYVMVNAYMLYFLQDALHYERLRPGQSAAQGVAALAVVALITKVPASLLGGWWSDRVGRRKPFVLFAGLGMAAGMALLALHPSWPAVVLAYGVFGIGAGAFFAVDLALVTQVLPSAEDAGKDLGLINLANTLPQSLGPLLAGALITWGGYPLFFLCAAGVSVLGALAVQPIRRVR